MIIHELFFRNYKLNNNNQKSNGKTKIASILFKNVIELAFTLYKYDKKINKIMTLLVCVLQTCRQSTKNQKKKFEIRVRKNNKIPNRRRRIMHLYKRDVEVNIF